MTTKDRLRHAATAYDHKQSKKPGHNRHALGIYFARVDEICADIDRGADPRHAIWAGFSGPIANACIKELGLSPLKGNSVRDSVWYYSPITTPTK